MCFSVSDFANEAAFFWVLSFCFAEFGGGAFVYFYFAVADQGFSFFSSLSIVVFGESFSVSSVSFFLIN